MKWPIRYSSADHDQPTSKNISDSISIEKCFFGFGYVRRGPKDEFWLKKRLSGDSLMPDKAFNEHASCISSYMNFENIPNFNLNL